MKSRLALVALFAFAGGSQGCGEQGFVYVEATSRLPPDTSLPGTSTTDLDAIDIDRDGDLDLFVTEGTDSAAVRPNRLLVNDGRGAFTDESAARLPSTAAANSTKTELGDLDGDGDLDALVANLGPEQLLLNDGHGVFVDASDRLPPPAPLLQDVSANVRLADVDGDGDLDALLSNENPFDPSPGAGAQNRIFINDGAARFTDETAARLPAIIDQTSAIVAGDIDGDRDVDLVVLNRGQDRVLVNDGRGFFTDETAARFPANDDSSRAGALTDLDGDGDLDLLVANSRNQPIAFYENRGGVFAARASGIAPLADETDTGLELADLDGDGHLDFYVPNAGAFASGHGFAGGPDRLFMNVGPFAFEDRTAEHFPVVPLDPTTAACFADLDRDGDPDLAVGNSGENGGERLFLYETKRDRHR